MNPIYYVIAALFALDAVLTLYAIHRFPRQLGEWNGFLRGLMKMIGTDGAMLLAKAAALAWVVCWQMEDAYLWAVVALYAGVVCWNARLIWKRVHG